MGCGLFGILNGDVVLLLTYITPHLAAVIRELPAMIHNPVMNVNPVELVVVLSESFSDCHLNVGELPRPS